MSDEPSYKAVGVFSKLIVFGMTNYWTILFLMIGCVFLCGLATLLENYLPPLQSFLIATAITVVILGMWLIGAAKKTIQDPEDSGYV